MRYGDVRTFGPKESEIGYQLEQWSQDFLDSYKRKLEKEGRTGPEYRLTGHFSFDFIVEESEETVYVLECNVVR